MVSKIVTTGARFAAKKIGNKALEKMSDTYDNTKRKVLQNTFGAKPLNVGEREFIDCLRTTGNRSQCEGVAQKAVKQYRKTGKYYHQSQRYKMERTKKIIYFFIGLAIIPAIATYFTVFVLKIDIFERLYNSLFFDYIFAYILTPLLYRPKIKKYISNKYVLFALIFFVFWLWEIFRITFI